MELFYITVVILRRESPPPPRPFPPPAPCLYKGIGHAFSPHLLQACVRWRVRWGLRGVCLAVFIVLSVCPFGLFVCWVLLAVPSLFSLLCVFVLYSVCSFICLDVCRWCLLGCLPFFCGGGCFYLFVWPSTCLSVCPFAVRHFILFAFFACLSVCLCRLSVSFLSSLGFVSFAFAACLSIYLRRLSVRSLPPFSPPSVIFYLPSPPVSLLWPSFTLPLSTSLSVSFTSSSPSFVSLFPLRRSSSFINLRSPSSPSRLEGEVYSSLVFFLSLSSLFCSCFVFVCVVSVQDFYFTCFLILSPFPLRFDYFLLFLLIYFILYS